MAYELTGTIKLIQEPQTFSSGFTKREVVVTVEEGKYPQDINLEFLQEKVGLLDTVAAGQKVKVAFDIRGREYNGRYFNNLVGWKLEPADSGTRVTDEEPPPGTDDFDAPREFDEEPPF